MRSRVITTAVVGALLGLVASLGGFSRGIDAGAGVAREPARWVVGSIPSAGGALAVPVAAAPQDAEGSSPERGGGHARAPDGPDDGTEGRADPAVAGLRPVRARCTATVSGDELPAVEPGDTVCVTGTLDDRLELSTGGTQSAPVTYSGGGHTTVPRHHRPRRPHRH